MLTNNRAVLPPLRPLDPGSQSLASLTAAMSAFVTAKDAPRKLRFTYVGVIAPQQKCLTLGEIGLDGHAWAAASHGRRVMLESNLHYIQRFIPLAISQPSTGFRALAEHYGLATPRLLRVAAQLVSEACA